MESRYSPILPLFQDEYRSMLNALKNEKGTEESEGWDLVDCVRNSVGQGKFNPPTYGSVDIDSDGVEHPCDPIFHPGKDSMTKQALDYIFWLRPNGQSNCSQSRDKYPIVTQVTSRADDSPRLTLNVSDT